MGHEILRRQDDRSVVGQLLSWFRERFAASPAPPKEPPSQRLVSSGRLQPGEDETSGEFAERVARIKADVLARALAAIESAVDEGADDPAQDAPVEEDSATSS